MALVLQNFVDGETIPLLASTTSSSVSFKISGSWSARDVMIYNAGPNLAFIAFHTRSAASPTAQIPGTNGTQNATPIPVGGPYLLCKNKHQADTTVIAAITSAGTAQLYFTAGEGN